MANNRSFILYMFAFGLFVPLVVIVVSYFSILRVVKKVNRPAAAIIDRKIIVWRYKVFVFEKTY
jgi:ABC-type glycerol-3-phosphate transport system permease component